MPYPWLLTASPQHGEQSLDPAPRLIIFVAVATANELQVRALGELLAAYSARIERAGGAGYYLDISDAPSAELLAQQLQQRVTSDLGLPVALGVAPNKIGARIAAASVAPGQQRRIALADLAGLLAPLPVRRLPGLSGQDVALLSELGIITIGQFATVPLPLLGVLLGARAADLHRIANGCDLRPVMPPAAAPSLQLPARFAATLDLNRIMAELRGLVGALCARLRASGRAARQMSLTVEFVAATATKQRRLGESVNADQVLLQIAGELLAEAMRTRRQRVRGLTVTLDRLTSAVVQLRLFVPSAEVLRYQRLNFGLDAIRAQFGAAAIQTADQWAHGYSGAIINWSGAAERQADQARTQVRLLGWTPRSPLFVPVRQPQKDASKEDRC